MQAELKQSLMMRSKMVEDGQASNAIFQIEMSRSNYSVSEEEAQRAETEKKTFEEKLALFESQISGGSLSRDGKCGEDDVDGDGEVGEDRGEDGENRGEDRGEEAVEEVEIAVGDEGVVGEVEGAKEGVEHYELDVSGGEAVGGMIGGGGAPEVEGERDSVGENVDGDDEVHGDGEGQMVKEHDDNEKEGEDGEIEHCMGEIDKEEINDGGEIDEEEAVEENLEGKELENDESVKEKDQVKEMKECEDNICNMGKLELSDGEEKCAGQAAAEVSGGHTGNGDVGSRADKSSSQCDTHGPSSLDALTTPADCHERGLVNGAAGDALALVQ